MFDRFILAFTRLYDGLFDELLREEIVAFDVIIVLATFGFILFFINAKVFAIFGGSRKAHQEHDQHDRVINYVEHIGDDSDEDDKDNDDLGPKGRR